MSLFRLSTETIGQTPAGIIYQKEIPLWSRLAQILIAIAALVTIVGMHVSDAAHSHPHVYWFAVILFIGFGMSAFYPSVVIEFDGIEKTITQRRASLFFRTVETTAFANVSRIQNRYDYNHNGGDAGEYVLSVYFRDGTPPLDMPGFSAEENETWARRLTTFVGCI